MRLYPYLPIATERTLKISVSDGAGVFISETCSFIMSIASSTDISYFVYFLIQELYKKGSPSTKHKNNFVLQKPSIFLLKFPQKNHMEFRLHFC